jgi:hypothetical protein
MSGANGVRACHPGGLLAVALLVMTTAAGWGLDTKNTRETLRGLTGVHVAVENVSPDLEGAGLTKSQLQTDAELRLRKAGIQVLTWEESLATSGRPYLYIRVTGFRVNNIQTGRPLGYVAFTEVALNQDVWLERESAIGVYDDVTWSSAGMLESVNSSNVRAIRESAADQVDLFINAYLAVNPVEHPLRAPSASKRLAPSNRDIQQAQVLLKATGFNPGPADGTLGERTRVALRQYQQVNGLPVTGELDQATQEALGTK